MFVKPRYYSAVFATETSNASDGTRLMIWHVPLRSPRNHELLPASAYGTDFGLVGHACQEPAKRHRDRNSSRSYR